MRPRLDGTHREEPDEHRTPTGRHRSLPTMEEPEPDHAQLTDPTTHHVIIRPPMPATRPSSSGIASMADQTMREVAQRSPRVWLAAQFLATVASVIGAYLIWSMVRYRSDAMVIAGSVMIGALIGGVQWVTAVRGTRSKAVGSAIATLVLLLPLHLVAPVAALVLYSPAVVGVRVVVARLARFPHGSHTVPTQHREPSVTLAISSAPGALTHPSRS